MARNPDEYPTAHTELKSGLKFTCVGKIINSGGLRLNDSNLRVSYKPRVVSPQSVSRQLYSKISCFISAEQLLREDSEYFYMALSLQNRIKTENTYVFSKIFNKTIIL